MTYGSGDSSNISYGYDNQLKVSSYQATSSVLSGGYVRKASYEYFGDGRTNKVNNLLDSGLDQNYRFDAQGRLTSSTSGQKLDNQSQMEEPFTQSISYNAFGDMTSRTNEVWGAQNSFNASYANGRKQNSNELYDAAGNLIDKTTASNKYDRWKFDAAGRNVETAMRWWQAVPAPSIDQTQTIAKTFDGDGRDVKRVDGNVWFHTFPDTNSGSDSTTEYYVRSTVLGGQTVTKLDGGGAKKVTLVYTGSSVLAEQRVIGGTSGVYWRHEDPATGSYGKTGVNGQYGGNADDSPTSVEYDPLGGEIPVADPDYDLIPAQLSQFKFAGDNSQAENRCKLNGAPIPCTMLSQATRGAGKVFYDINIRAEGGYDLYYSLRGLVSTWRYNVRQIVDPEDQSIPTSTYNQPQRWGKLADGRHTLLVGSFYASYLSSFAETLISRQTRQQKDHLTDAQLDNIRKRIPEVLTDKCADYINKVMRAHTGNADFDARKDLLNTLDYVRQQAPEYGFIWGRMNLAGRREISLVRPQKGHSGLMRGLSILTVVHELIHTAAMSTGRPGADDDLSQTVSDLGIKAYKDNGELMEYKPNPNDPKDVSHRQYWAQALKNHCPALYDPSVF